MPEYIIFPIPIGLLKIKASSQENAVKIYHELLPEQKDSALMCVPATFATQEVKGNLIPLWKCERTGDICYSLKVD